ncbi:hypothetical protein AUK40_01780 [Candidatus Wirthbacteria bacterium CG2_30_54_11]|uniref:CBS domain-containing protein n=1 Tax=Candidatus Wirthbacteria bacterium CG2_30_54_11 TaxID=1817892 RepID=A0A1J5J183_9BACT|nr:MAG: hypothetical protein AUK40_01780 [Candidatus Wirthbacteria bacterium CG2_30_54_11]
MLYLSSLLGARILDNANVQVGTLKDVAVPITEAYPKVAALVISQKNRTETIVPADLIELVGKGIVTLKKSCATLPFFHLGPEHILLRKSVLDRQIVDCEGLKVVRANDIALGKVQGDLSVISIDVSILGILRRLNLDGLPFLNRIKEDLVPWNEMSLVDSTMPELKLHEQKNQLQKLHPADIANIVEELNAKRGAAFLSQLEPEIAADVIEEMDEDDQVALIEHLDAEQAGDILEDMSPDQAADILDELSDDKAQEIIAELEPEEGEKILELITYDAKEAGGLMTTEFFSVRPDWNVREVKNALKGSKDDIPTITYIYVTEEDGTLKGVLSLRRLSTSEDQKKMKEIMSKKPFFVSPTASIKQIAGFLTKYDLFSVAVAREDRKMLGIVMVDDIMRELFPEA